MPPRILAAAKTRFTIMPKRATRAPVCRLLAATFDVGCSAEDISVKKTINVAVYETHGKPDEVLIIVEQPYPAPAPDQALVQMLAAPINPADLNAIEGKYPGRPEVPATPGMEGVGVIVETGSQFDSIKVGD